MTVSLTQVQNVRLGACNVKYGTVDLGLTKGGVAVTISTQQKAITVDQFGQTVLNDFIMGRTGTVKVPMAESDLVKLCAVIPGSTLVTDHIDATKKKLLIPSAVGQSLLDTALPLLLHPTANADSNKSEDVLIGLAAPGGNITFDFQAENERIYLVEFTMYPDPATGLMLTVGDPTASAT
jgi:hypothetical protein